MQVARELLVSQDLAGPDDVESAPGRCSAEEKRHMHNLRHSALLCFLTEIHPRLFRTPKLEVVVFAQLVSLGSTSLHSPGLGSDVRGPIMHYASTELYSMSLCRQCHGISYCHI